MTRGANVRARFRPPGCPPKEKPLLTREEMTAQAIALRPKLLKRASELVGPRSYADAEDLVGVVYLAMVERPPTPSNSSQLNHWLRTVLRNQAALAYRNLYGAVVVSYEAIQETRSGSAAEE